MSLTQVSTGGIKDGQVHTADLADGQITAGKLHADALDRTYTLGASGTNHYTFTGEGLTGAVNDPTLYLTRGKTYRFVNGNSSGAHPFRIQTTVNGSAGTEYNTGVTNNGGAGGSTIVFEVPHDAPDVLYYQCTSHNSMGGILYVTGALADGTVTTAKIANQAITNAKLGSLAVNAGNLAPDSVTEAVLSDHSSDDSLRAVGTNHIKDEAVTLAKLPHGTSSNDGKFLRANNGADPTFESITIPAGIPSGGIIIWSGNGSNIPTGFVICDGNNSTPDLRDRFVVGAAGTYNAGDTGGANTVTLTVNEIPSHSHPGRFWPHGGSVNISYPGLPGHSGGNVSQSSSGTGSTGGGAAHENRPPYYALCYIMKT